MNKTGCRDCKKRYIGCHSRCQVYKDYKKTLESRKEPTDYDLAEYLRQAYHRMSGYKYRRGQV